MGSPRIIYSARRDAMAETQIWALANIYRFVLDRHAKKEAAPKSRPDDARKDQDAGTFPNCT
jgi:hypothetical protein